MTTLEPRARARAFFAFQQEGQGIAGPDEDLFTLAVAAGERLESAIPRAADPVPRSIWVTGDAIAGSWEDLPIALGLSPAGVHELGEGSTGPQPTPEPDPRHEVVWIDVRDRTGPAPGSATAVLLGPVPGGPSARPGAASVETTADLARLLAEATNGRLGEPPGGNGPSAGAWEGGPRAQRPPPTPATGWAPPNLEAVSEGAYIPWPTYREGLAGRWRFAADRCSSCGRLSFPARGRCGRCGRSSGLERIELPRSGGRIEAITTVHAGAQPTEFDFQVDRAGSYDVALVRLAPEAIATLQVTDAAPGTLRVGDPVDTCLRRLYPMEGKWRYGRKARPMPPPPQGS
jgi:uncharacterized OB-fold protein